VARRASPGTVLLVPTLPREAELYRALVERDATYDGLFFVGVRTTGIFCRPTCPAKKPLRENVAFFTNADDAERAGFRACKRCRPLDPIGLHPAWVERLIGDVRERSRSSGSRMSDDDLRLAGYEPVNARRYFKERFGMTFQAYQRSLWLEQAHSELSNGASPSEVALDSGFESESGIRAAFMRCFGTTPSRVSGGRVISAAFVTTPPRAA
jgi:AraC family transcriptional regulator of adaptative response/methylated-DNA-[protein]-cysteine methyltransferase